MQEARASWKHQKVQWFRRRRKKSRKWKWGRNES